MAVHHPDWRCRGGARLHRPRGHSRRGPPARCVSGVPAPKANQGLQIAIIDNPSIGNYEELGDLYLDDKQYARRGSASIVSSRPATDRQIPFTAVPSPRRRWRLSGRRGRSRSGLRARSEVRLPARRGPARAVRFGKIGEREKAAEFFADVTTTSTLSETQYSFAHVCWPSSGARKKLASGPGAFVGEETDCARVRPSSQTSMVSQGRGPAQTASAFGAAVIVFGIAGGELHRSIAQLRGLP